MESDGFFFYYYYGFEHYRIVYQISFGVSLVGKNPQNILNNAYLTFIFLLVIVMKPECFASLSDCTCY